MSRFKAALIEDEAYYKIRKKTIIFSVLSATIIGVLSNVFTMPAYLIAPMIAIALSIIYYQYQNYTKLNNIVSKKRLEVDDDEIKVLNKSKQILEQFVLEESDTIVVKEDYDLAEKDLSSTLNELNNKPVKNYIILNRNNEEHRFEFFLDSHYMIVQLQKIIERWKGAGFNVIHVG